MLTELARAAELVTGGARLLRAAELAAQGDEEARRFLLREGIDQAADLVRPGAGGLTRRIRHAVDDWRAGQQAVEGEYRVLEAAGCPSRSGTGWGSPAPPWERFRRHWWSLPSGGNVLLGPIGQGKTTLARHLASRLHELHGHDVEYVSIYDDDRGPLGADLSPERLATRVARILLTLHADAEEEDPDDAAVPREERTAWRRFLARVRVQYGDETIDELRDIFGGRVIVVDEAGAAQGDSPHDPYRRAIVRSLDQCRHVGWHVLLIAQRAGGIPKEALAAATIWVKQPAGREYAFDRDNPEVRRLWLEAGDAFAELRRHPFWPEFPDPRAWSYVDNPPRDRWRGWRGMVPFAPAAIRQGISPGAGE